MYSKNINSVCLKSWRSYSTTDKMNVTIKRVMKWLIRLFSCYSLNFFELKLSSLSLRVKVIFRARSKDGATYRIRHTEEVQIQHQIRRFNYGKIDSLKVLFVKSKPSFKSKHNFSSKSAFEKLNEKKQLQTPANLYSLYLNKNTC